MNQPNKTLKSRSYRSTYGGAADFPSNNNYVSYQGSPIRKQNESTDSSTSLNLPMINRESPKILTSKPTTSTPVLPTDDYANDQ